MKTISPPTQALLAAIDQEPMTLDALAKHSGLTSKQVGNRLRNFVDNGEVVVHRRYSMKRRWACWYARPNATITEPVEVTPVRRYSASMRPCLCCQKPFASAGAHNRLCGNCKRQETTPFDYVPH